MNSVKMARDTPSVMIYLEANMVREPLVYKALKASLWLLRILKVFFGSTWWLTSDRKGYFI